MHGASRGTKAGRDTCGGGLGSGARSGVFVRAAAAAAASATAATAAAGMFGIGSGGGGINSGIGPRVDVHEIDVVGQVDQGTLGLQL